MRSHRMRVGIGRRDIKEIRSGQQRVGQGRLLGFIVRVCAVADSASRNRAESLTLLDTLSGAELEVTIE
jgi:hypothetical protein